MCLIDGVDHLTLIAETKRKARKAHTCSECGRDIQPGETYTLEVGKSDDIEVYKTCSHCLVVRDWLSAECDGWVYTMTEEDLAEHCDGRGHPMSLYRLAVGQRRYWRTRKGALMPVPKRPPTTHERMKNVRGDHSAPARGEGNSHE